MEMLSLLFAQTTAVVTESTSLSLLSWAFVNALIAIIIIDIMLAGDNAIVIAMAARNLPKNLQKKAIIWGTAGAIIVRTILTLLASVLLDLPVVRLVGGVLLFWIAYKLIAGDDSDEGEKAPADSFRAAIMTIVVADTVMGLDNVLAVAGAAATGGDQHSFLLIMLGLIISIPIMVFASTMILKLIERFPIIVYIGSAVLVKVAVNMIANDPFYVDSIKFMENPIIYWSISLVAIVVVLGLGYMKKSKSDEAKSSE